MPVDLPPNAVQYLPVLVQEVKQHWPELPYRSVLAAQVEQETCPSLKSKKCWSPYAELKTDREYGFGLGQVTKTSKFDNFLEAKKLHKTLAEWKWEERYNAEYQLRTLVLMMKSLYSKITWAANDPERIGMALSSYNGGMGGLLQDKMVCKLSDKCDPTLWFGHIADHSKKAKKPVSGYGKSFFEINREYVVNIMVVRRAKYAVPTCE